MLRATRTAATSADGALVSTATGVYLYVAMAGVLFVLAAVPAIMLVRNRPAAPAVPGAPQRPGAPAVGR